MKAAFGVEAIGLGASDEITAKRLGMEREMNRMTRPWLAEIVGFTSNNLFQYDFLKGKVDYTDANSRGTRGVWYWWTLTPGPVYETRHRTGWKISSQVTRYLRVDDAGDIIDLTLKEVWAWLEARTNADSGSTS